MRSIALDEVYRSTSMSFFDKIVKKVFPKTDNPAVGVAVHEVLKRNNREIKEFDNWKISPVYSRFLENVAQAYYYKKAGIQSDITIHLFQSAYANGFAINYLPEIGKKQFQHLFEFFKERVLEMDYRLANADRQIIDKKNYVETREKYYMKPPLNLQQSADLLTPNEQLYGNVSLEYVLTNDSPQYIKLLVSIYSDRLYKHALSFDEFVDRLFEIDNDK